MNVFRKCCAYNKKIHVHNKTIMVAIDINIKPLEINFSFFLIKFGDIRETI